MERTKAAATAHSGIDPGGPWGPQLSCHRPNMPQGEGLEKQEFPPAVIPPPRRLEGRLPGAPSGSAHSHTCAGREGRRENQSLPHPSLSSLPP